MFGTHGVLVMACIAGLLVGAGCGDDSEPLTRETCEAQGDTWVPMGGVALCKDESPG